MLRTLLLLFSLVFAAFGVLSCGEAGLATQTVMRFDAAPDFTVPAGTRIHVVVYRNDERQHEAGADLGDALFEADTQLVIDAQSGDANRRFTVFAELVDGVGERLSWVRVRSGFVAGSLSEVRVHFHPGCPAPPDRVMQAVGYDGTGICGSHDTCREAEGGESPCQSACVEPEPFAETPLAEATPKSDCPETDCAPVDSLELGWESSCAMSGTDVFCWGRIGFAGIDMGRLNRPSLILNPAGVATPDTAYVEVETVIRQTCVLTDMGEIRCGGDGNGNNGDNRLGTGTDDKSYRQCCVSRPDPAPPLFSAIGAESGYTCGISRDDGSIWCAGSNPASATGSDVYEQRTPDGGYEDLRLGRNYFCGIRDNILDCFTGTNPLPDDAPIDITGHRSLSTGNQAMCLVTATGELRCYGADPWKEDYPVNPALLGTGWQSVAIPQHGLEVDRNGHRCGIREDGTLRCWGENGETDPNANGRVGVDSALMSRVPEDMPVQVGVETDWTSVAVGYQHTCGIRGDRELYCWGRNQSGQLGRSGSGFEAGHVCLPRW